MSQPGALLSETTDHSHARATLAQHFFTFPPTCSGLHQKAAFTGIVLAAREARSTLRRFDSFFGCVLRAHRAEAPCPSAPAARQHTSFPRRLIPLSPTHTRPQREPLQTHSWPLPIFLTLGILEIKCRGLVSSSFSEHAGAGSWKQEAGSIITMP